MKAFSLKGKNAIVTGAVGILGTPSCRGLAEAGANVAVVDLDEKKCLAAAAALRKKYGVRTIGIGCDVSDPASVQAMVKNAAGAFRRIDILHNNAATKTDDVNVFFEKTEKYSLKGWQQIMAVNLDGMFLVAQAVGNQMIKQKSGGSIVQMGSIYGVLGPDLRIYEGSSYFGRKINTPAVYTASKAGVIGLTKYLATSWAKHDIRVNSISPGGVRSGQNKTFMKRYSARIPLGRMAEPHEIVNTLIFLASDASSYITGQNLMVDGGLTAW